VFSYQFFFGTFLFLFNIEQENDVKFDLSDLDQERQSSKAQIVNDNEEAFNLRLAFIENANASIQIAIHQFHDDQSANIITYALIERLKEEVQVDILVDGVMNGSLRQENYRLLAHYGANFKVYEPNVFLLPQRGQNRLHDKLFIFDEEYAIISGRNIGDRYFQTNSNSVGDRDLYFTDQKAIEDATKYFEDLFTSDYAKDLKAYTPDFVLETEMKEAYQDYMTTIDIEAFYQRKLEEMVDVESMLFLHNPIHRMKKEPLVMETLLALVKREGSSIIQSPYVVFDQELSNAFSQVKDLDITILTNTIETSPNIFASSGYMYDRKEIASIVQLYEIQSEENRHTKTWLIGQDYLAVGSLNIDPRSSSLSTESMVLVKSETLALNLKTTMLEELNQSFLVDEDGDYVTKENIDPVDQTFFKEAMVRFIGLFTYFFHDLL
jgi:putative cardiolipin synthase